MINLRYNDVQLYDFEFVPGSIRVSSEEIENELNMQLSILAPGTLEKLTGVAFRRMWPANTMPSVVATQAAEAVLHRSPHLVSKIGCLINFSVSRDYFEPATSVLVHKRLGLPRECMCFDISNACIGFSNALSIASAMIEAKKIESALLVAGETVMGLVESTINRIKRIANISREDLLSFLPVLTLGSGAVAFLVTRRGHDAHPTPVAAVCESETALSDLCEGNADYCIADYVFDKISKLADRAPIMRTEAKKLIESASLVGKRVWKRLQAMIGWTSQVVDKVICHQVGKHVNELWYKTVGLDKSKEITIYRDYGNMVSVALPGALAIAANNGLLRPKDKVLTLGFGSGLNAIFTAWRW
ncbi:MAG: 3-oxoacyl-ACP synthase III [Deltaproteobacteria bacterium]|nr:3-oxoacyl-ACP synthase III [Deltaproteobacteria bacterium]